jgi:glyoxylase-like metal-dependent hydrolase (beta-lactamase superfamily II)
MAIEHLRIQYGVGQGSFHAAHVQYQNEVGESARFDYVYDCGGLNAGKPSKASLRALEHYEPRVEDGATVIDALVLSHYDADHINGAEYLATHHRVGQIYLPYLSPNQLLLEIAKCASDANTATFDVLYAGAFGGAVWGAHVVRVRRGARPDEPPQEPRPEPRPEQPREPREVHGPEFPEPLRPVLETGQPVPPLLDDDMPVMVETAFGQGLWTLKFWNFSLQDEELQLMAAALLESIGFPLSAVEELAGASKVLTWLNSKGNRAAAVEAYRVALGEYSKQYPPVANMANLCSLALFSCPAQRIWPGTYWASPNLYPYHWYRDDRRYGWVGTGDALLGEAHIWADFSAHYRDELSRTRTVLIPHHGAAPRDGPSFYNPGLNDRRATITVISAGAQNNYGHPRSSVLQQILRRFGLLQVVTEHSWPGFVERLELE